jgi:hypothetical protein
MVGLRGLPGSQKEGAQPAQPSPEALAGVGGEGCWGCRRKQPNVYAQARRPYWPEQDRKLVFGS